MKYIGQFAILLMFSFLGEALHRLLPLPIPASVYGILLLFASLCTGIVRLRDIEDTGNFLLEIMPICFVAPAVNIMDVWEEMLPYVIPLSILTGASTVVVFFVAGRITQWLERKRK